MCGRTVASCSSNIGDRHWLPGIVAELHRVVFDHEVVQQPPVEGGGLGHRGDGLLVDDGAGPVQLGDGEIH
jgi:hypothetical protein